MKNPFKIEFEQKYIYMKHVEKMLLQKWKGSHEKCVHIVLFELKKCEYMDLMQICQLFLWVESLLIIGKVVRIDFGDAVENPNSIVYVIKNYGFFSLLSQYSNFTTNPEREYLQRAVGGKLEDSPLVHLTIFDEVSKLDKFLDQLGDSEDVNWNAGAGEKDIRTSIRDILLREIGYNVFVHSEGSPALLAVSKKSKKQLLIKRNPIPIQAVAQETGASEFIQVVIADLGVGIPKKLSGSFESDSAAALHFEENNQTNIIEYSFWKDTSSRRRKIEEQLLKAEDHHPVPPTGLYFVNQFVKQSNGLICVRSGQALWSEQYIEQKVISLEYDMWGVDKLEELPGTVINILLPITEKLFPLKKSESPSSLKELPIIDSYISWDEGLLGHNDEKQATTVLVSDVRDACAKYKSGQGVLVDLNKRPVHAKRLYQIAMYLIFYQEKDRPIIIINPPNGVMWDEVCDEVKSELEGKEIIPIAWFGENTSGVIGKQGLTVPSYSMRQIMDVIEEIKLKQIRDRVRSVFYPNQKVFLPGPSNYFIKGFYDLADIVEDDKFARQFAAFVVTKIKTDIFAAIIITSSRLRKIARLVAFELSLTEEDVFFLSGTGSPVALVMKLDSQAEGKFLLLADAVVSGNTIERIAKNLTPIRRESVTVAIVKSQEVSGIISPVKHNFSVYYSKPNDWSYDDIYPIDSATHTLINEEYKNDAGREDIYELLTRWSEKDRVVSVGHFSYKQTCYLVFFRTIEIEERYNDEIFEYIRGDLNGLLRKKPKSKVIFSFPHQNKAARKLCGILNRYVGGIVEEVQIGKNITKKERRGDSEDKPRIMVFVDMAASTMKTIRYAMEYANLRGCNMLQAYAAINRASHEEFSFIDGIQVFKNIETRLRSWTRINIPAYERNACPACIKMARIKELLNKDIPLSCKRVVKMEAGPLALVPIKEAREKAMLKPVETLPGFGKALYFRHILESSLVDGTMGVTASLKKLLDNLCVDTQGKRELINVLYLEAPHLASGGRFDRAIDNDLRSHLLNICLDLIHSGDNVENVDAKSIWMAADIDFDWLLRKLNTDKWTITDSGCRALLTVLLYNDESDRREPVINLLRKLSTKIEACEYINVYQNTVLAVSELATKYELDPGNEVLETGRYVESVNALKEFLFQRGRSHTQARTAFDAVRQIPVKEDLVRAVKRIREGGEYSFHNIVKNRLFPAIALLKRVWPKEMIQSTPYIFNGGVNGDIERLITEIEIGGAMEETGKLTPELWIEKSDVIRETSARLLKNLFHVDTSMLNKLLSKCVSDVSAVLDDVKRQLENSSKEKAIDIYIIKDERSALTLIPAEVLNDILLTVLDNAVRYSRESTDIICELSHSNTNLQLEVRSIPKENTRAMIVKGHGLYRTREILVRMEGGLHLGEGVDGEYQPVVLTIPKGAEK
ncbi:MAG: ATP-binding protein [Candidatus Thiodiazotropha endolucinida]